MVQINPALPRLQKAYLFQEIAQKVQSFRRSHPDADILNLGIGDTPGPLHPKISQAIKSYAEDLTIEKSFEGYGPSEGVEPLRQALSKAYYQNILDSQELYLSDGAKCDLSRLLFFFGPQMRIGIQSPSYPAFIDDIVISGASGSFNTKSGSYDSITYFSSTSANHFSPDFKNQLGDIDILYLCNPNNPTGSCFSKSALAELVREAQKNQVIIIYDVAYRDFITDPSLPKSIYEIPGAKEVAIEVGSFSKSFNFTGIRLGWVAIPEQLKFDDGQSVGQAWSRYINTTFNGPSRLAQHAGLAALDQDVFNDAIKRAHSTTVGAQMLKQQLVSMGFTCYGGENAPYVWFHHSELSSSWETFDFFLSNFHIATVPGIGFGPDGQAYLRMSAFPNASVIKKAILRLKESASKFQFSEHR